MAAGRKNLFPPPAKANEGHQQKKIKKQVEAAGVGFNLYKFVEEYQVST